MHEEQSGTCFVTLTKEAQHCTPCLLGSFTRCCCAGTNPLAVLVRSLLLGFSRDVRGLNEMVILSNMCCSSVCTVKWRLSQFQAPQRLLPLRGTNGSGRSRSPAAPLVGGWRTPAPTRGQAKTYNVCWGFQPSSRSGWWERLLRAVAWIQPRSSTWSLVRCWNPAVGCSARRPADGQETASFGFRS